MPSSPPFGSVLQLAADVTVVRTADGGVVKTPIGRRVCVTALEFDALLAFRRPISVQRALAFVGSDQARAALYDRISDWLDHGVLRVGRTTHGSTPSVTMTNSESSNIFFVYAGAQGGVMMNPLEFLRQSGLSRQNVVLLRDASQTWFLNGVGDGITTFGELVAWQSGFLEGVGRGVNHYCVGSSMGAFSALVFGHVLKAREVWSFGLARTTVPLRDGDGQPWDLRRLLAEWNGVSRYRLYFNESWARDREAAVSLEHLPGVTLHPQDGEGHVVLRHLLTTGALARLFPVSGSVPTGSQTPARHAAVSDGSVLQVLRSILPPHAEVPDVTARLAGVLDSFALVALLERLATDLGVNLDPDRLGPADFESVSAITRAIARESNA